MLMSKRLKAACIVIALIGLALAPVRGLTAETNGKSPDYRELRLFRQVMQLVQRNYVKDVPDKDLVQGAINGMLQSLDPHSSFLNEEQFKELQVETKGEFGGLGIEITLENGVLTIVSPIEDTPAFRAGLKHGDKIIKINGESTRNITLQKAVKLMRGPRGTKVTVTIMREGFRSGKDFAITRDIIRVQSVKKEQLETDYPYVRLIHFQENTDTDLDSAIKELGGDEIKGLIIDLRNNPGGLLDQSYKVASLFLEKGKLIVHTDGRMKDQRMELYSTKSGKPYKFRIAVLINEGSASASEIVAGALQDYDRAVIFGTKSFGKASVQTIIPLENGSGLRLTTAYYYTPKGRHIQKTGILPDVDMKAEVQKQQEEEAEEEAKPEKKKENLLKPRGVKTKEDLLKDPVVKKAMEWLKSDVGVQQEKEKHEKPASADTAMKAPSDD
jgi:carboxyl-terminal processing protease